ncbi:hypothetical protein GH714_011680 [Hevea brasiliensis]|uniref:Reverse transcriptase Ty1/copia-type domain-containing protein n=1 Tax=Hevea brasiliensis TaxID=3981 RepID=A0A6A6L476_HEVBR|nr:hypothetical protein GH714_011680 [Hevea brasiliensis]
MKRLSKSFVHVLHYGLPMKRSSKSFVHAYSEADCIGDKDDRTSTSAFIVYFGNTAISWSSRKQQSVARSFIEAEYRAVASTTSKLAYIKSLLDELGISLLAPPKIFCDNIGATYVCANPMFHSKMKHIAIDYHFVHDQVSKELLYVPHVSTQDQLADALTKPLSKSQFVHLLGKIGILYGLPILQEHIGNIHPPPIRDYTKSAFTAQCSPKTKAIIGLMARDINLSKRRGGPGKRMKGSFLLNDNQSATNATPAYLFKYRYVTAMELEENEYYHQVWKCICGEDIFSP